MNKNIGFIGCGNMGQAMIGGILKSGIVATNNIIASALSETTLTKLTETFSINTTKDNKYVATFSDILVLAVKPNMYDKVIEEIKDYIKDNAVIVTIAAGISIFSIEHCFNKKIKIIRTMPNTPALVGEGITAISKNKQITDEDLQEVIKIFESFGKTEIIDEKLMDIIPAVSGSSPAYVYMFIEALADGAVLGGMPRDKAYRFAAQAVLGSAKMVLETGEHPGSLKDKVCSPAGTTIEAVYTLEKNNFRGTIISAMESCTKKAIKMSEKNI